MDIKVKVTTIEKEGSKVKGYASVVLDNCFAVNGIKIMDGPNGDFVSYPNYKSGNDFKNICNPTTKDFRETLNSAILTEYTNKLNLVNEAQNVIDSEASVGIHR